MCELRQAGDDVSDGVNARLVGLHEFSGLDEAAVRLDLGFFQANVVGARRASDRDQNFFRFDGGLLSVFITEGDAHAGLRLLDLLHLYREIALDTALGELAQQFLRYIFVFDRNDPWQHLENGYVAPERMEDGCKLHTDRAGTDHDHAFWDRRDA